MRPSTFFTRLVTRARLAISDPVVLIAGPADHYELLRITLSDPECGDKEILQGAHRCRDLVRLAVPCRPEAGIRFSDEDAAYLFATNSLAHPGWAHPHDARSRAVYDLFRTYLSAGYLEPSAQRKSSLPLAVRWGNLDFFMALVDAGVDASGVVAALEQGSDRDRHWDATHPTMLAYLKSESTRRVISDHLAAVEPQVRAYSGPERSCGI